MNERIKELAEQAGCKVMDDGDWYIPSATGLEKIVYTSGIGLEKFAELIVRECAELSVNSQYANTRSEYYEGFNEALVYVGNKIKQHFGVKE